jgi:hypothetical protein
MNTAQTPPLAILFTKGEHRMKAALSRWTVAVLAVGLPLALVAGCDEGDHHDGFGADAILAIIYAVGDVVLAIVEAVT